MLSSPPEPDNECLETGETLIVAATANKRRTKCEFIHSFSFLMEISKKIEKKKVARLPAGLDRSVLRGDLMLGRNSAVKGNQSERRWCYYSIAITSCNQHLIQDDTSRPRTCLLRVEMPH